MLICPVKGLISLLWTSNRMILNIKVENTRFWGHYTDLKAKFLTFMKIGLLSITSFVLWPRILLSVIYLIEHGCILHNLYSFGYVSKKKCQFEILKKVRPTGVFGHLYFNMLWSWKSPSYIHSVACSFQEITHGHHSLAKAGLKVAFCNAIHAICVFTLKAAISDGIARACSLLLICPPCFPLDWKYLRYSW